MDPTHSRIRCGNKRVKNVVVDHLSMLKNSEGEIEKESSIREEFPDEYIFSVSITPWCADIVNFLASDILPHNLSYQQKKKFFSDIKHYLWEDLFFLYIKCLQMGRLEDVGQMRNMELLFTIAMIGRLKDILEL